MGDPGPVLVLGASGYLGRHLVAELHSRGRRVRALVRDRDRAERPGSWGAPALSGLVDEWVVGEVGDPDVVARAVDGVGAIVSALGVTQQKADPWQIDFGANVAVLDEAVSQGVGRFCFVNAIGADRCPAEVTRAKTAFAQRLREANITGQVVSPSAYFSDLAQVLDMARRGRVFLLDPAVRINPIHAADLAAHCADRLDEGVAGSWDVGGPQTMTWKQVADTAFAALGAPVKVTTVPSLLTRAAIKVLSLVNRRLADTLTFITWAMQHDAVGEPTGEHLLAEFYADQVRSTASEG